MESMQKFTKWAGFLILLCMIAGILSVAPSVDSSDYLSLAAEKSSQVISAAIFQFIMALLYVGFAILLYPILKQFSHRLSLGFLGFRIIAASLVVIGTVLLASILSLSSEFVREGFQDKEMFEAFGSLLKVTRDSINHGFMVFALSSANIIFYVILIKWKLIPQWLSVWGIFGAFLSVLASVLVLYQVIDVITAEYIILNIPTALAELIMGFWLIKFGFEDINLDEDQRDVLLT
jgi:hypothetical protein